MKANIKLSLSSLTPVAILALLRNVIAKLTGNTWFATPAVPLADMTTLADALEVAIEAATNGSRQSKLQRDDLVAAAKTMLTTQADYVRTEAGGDRTKLESSGFELRRTPQPIGVPGAPQKLEARMSDRKGIIKLRWRSEHGAHGYQVWMTDKDPTLEANWTAVGYTTRVSHLVDSLESYKAYWFCVSAIGTAGEGMQSDPAMGRAA